MRSSTCDPSTSSSLRRARLTRSEIRERRATSALLRSLTHARRLFGRELSVTPTQAPLRAATGSVLGEPKSVLAPTRASTGPSGAGSQGHAPSGAHALHGE